MGSFISVKSKVPSAEEIRKAFKAPIGAMMEANTKAVATVSDAVLKLGRVNISASGKFTGRWVSGLQVRRYPKRRSSLRPKAYVNHKFGGLAGVFEFGTRILPKTRTYLWVPLPGTPKRTTLGASFQAGRLTKTTKRTTAGRMGDKRNGLVFLKPKGGKPTLGVMRGTGKRAKFKPMFVGIKAATIRPRWSVLDIVKEQSGRLPGLIEQELKKAAKK